ncbi:MAG: CoB--CoM heterodisulfide reductase iron-sulfur subunit B family protein [Clostridia bacterium]|nr:CoB--CoM heterodisulfide reductase iron-sulfur subunit B family protein [Clostridia bacterium]
MVFQYYPGCTLRTKAKELDRKARLAAEALGVTLNEIPEWQCCGGCYPVAKDEIATKLSAVRVMMAANEAQTPVVTVCSACHNVLKRVNSDMANDEVIRDRVNRYLQNETPYAGEGEVIHFIEMLRDKVGFDKIREMVKNPLTGRKIGAYYGCLLLRPGKVMAFDDPENPTIIEDFIRALGAEPVVYPYRNECCGAYLALEDKNVTAKKSSAVLHSAKCAGAECVITACPLCLYNLQKSGGEIPAVYFTELLYEALGLE